MVRLGHRSMLELSAASSGQFSVANLPNPQMLVYHSGGKLEYPNRAHEDHIKSLQLQGDSQPTMSDFVSGFLRKWNAC